MSEAKRQILEQALQQGVAKIVIVPSVSGVQLPAHLMVQEIVKLNLSRRFGGELAITDDAVRAELSFNKQKTLVVLPWGCVQGIVDAHGRAFAFREDELVEYLVPSEPFKLYAIEGGCETTPPRTGHLRLLN